MILKSCPEAGRRCYLTDDDDPDPGVDSELGDDPVGYAPAHDESHRAPDDGGDAEIEAAAGVGVVGLIVQLSIVGPSESGWKHNGGVKCEPASRQWWALDVTCLSDARRQAQEQHDGTEEAPETVTHGQPEGRNGINLAGWALQRLLRVLADGLIAVESQLEPEQPVSGIERGGHHQKSGDEARNSGQVIRPPPSLRVESLTDTSGHI